MYYSPINLKLKRNSDILAPSFKTYIHEGNEITNFNETPADCHYLHQGPKVVAAFSICNPKAVVTCAITL